jgi:hypothetical protein
MIQEKREATDRSAHMVTKQGDDHWRDVDARAQTPAATVVLAGLFVRPTRLAFDPIGNGLEIAG